MECSAQPPYVNPYPANKIPRGIEKCSFEDIHVIKHHIYEFEKGLRSLILHTMKKECLNYAISILSKREIPYLIYPAGEVNMNVFFGDEICLDVVRKIGKENLAEYSNEEDFILGIMLGYSRLKQCQRYLERKERHI